jgi:hypothetical protein
MYKVLRFDGNPEVAFRGIHDDRQTAGADGEVPSEIHIEFDFVPVESGGIHDDTNNRLQVVLTLRPFGKGRGGRGAIKGTGGPFSGWGVAVRRGSLPECREGDEPRFSPNL